MKSHRGAREPALSVEDDVDWPCGEVLDGDGAVDRHADDRGGPYAKGLRGRETDVGGYFGTDVGAVDLDRAGGGPVERCDRSGERYSCMASCLSGDVIGGLDGRGGAGISLNRLAMTVG